MRPSSTWILIIAILLTADFVSYSASLKDSKDLDYEGDSGCNIQALHDSQYVRAYRMEFASSSSCNASSESSSPKSSSKKEVHILYVLVPSNNSQSGGKNSQTPQVILNIVANGENTVKNLDVVLVLASNQSVTWKIVSDFLPKIRHLNLWVSRNSRILPISGSNVKVMKFETILGVPQIRRWATEKFNQITAVKELSIQRKIVVAVGLVGSSRGKMCKEQNLEEISEVTKGCVMPTNRGLNNKDVHIIELEGSNSSSLTVALNIKARSNVPLRRRHLLLVLKSHRPTKWVILTAKLRGTLDIITDQTVDANRIDMQSVRVVNEILSNLSELRLVAWTVSNYGAPLSYTSTNNANRIDLTVDGVDENWKRRQDFGGNLKLNRTDVQTLLEHIRTSVEQHRSVSCLPGYMEVALLKSPLMPYSFKNDQLSLSDPRCQAQQNNTHFFWKTSPELCGSVLRRSGNSMAVENAILVQPVKPSVGDSVDDFSGSGMENAKENENSYDDTFSDDEDFVSSSLITVRVNFGCSYFVDTKPPDEDVDYYLKIYKDRSFQHEMISFPVSIPEGQNLYVSTGFDNGDEVFRPVIEKCSIVPLNSSEPLEYPLIINGCLADRMVSWKDSGGTASEVRFKVQIHEEWKHHARVYLLCDVTVCSSLSSHIIGMTQCKPESHHCSSSDVGLQASFQSSISAKAMKAGPLILPAAANGAFAARSSQGKSSTLGYEVRNEAVQDDSTSCNQVIRVEGLDTPTAVAIAFAAFLIGALLSGTLWYIHSRTGGAKKRALRRKSAETSGESTPCSTAPITVSQALDQI